MILFLIYSLVLYWGNVSKGNVTMKSSQLHYFLSQNVGETKDFMSPCPKVAPFPLELGHCPQHMSCLGLLVRLSFCVAHGDASLWLQQLCNHQNSLPKDKSWNRFPIKNLQWFLSCSTCGVKLSEDKRCCNCKLSIWFGWIKYPENHLFRGYLFYFRSKIEEVPANVKCKKSVDHDLFKLFHHSEKMYLQFVTAPSFFSLSLSKDLRSSLQYIVLLDTCTTCSFRRIYKGWIYYCSNNVKGVVEHPDPGSEVGLCGGQKMAPHENKWSPPDGAHE